MNTVRAHNWQVIHAALATMQPGDVITDRDILALLPGSTMTSALVAFREAARAVAKDGIGFIRIRGAGYQAAANLRALPAPDVDEEARPAPSRADLLMEQFGPIPWAECADSHMGVAA